MDHHTQNDLVATCFLHFSSSLHIPLSLFLSSLPPPVHLLSTLFLLPPSPLSLPFSSCPCTLLLYLPAIVLSLPSSPSAFFLLPSFLSFSLSSLPSFSSFSPRCVSMALMSSRAI